MKKITLLMTLLAFAFGFSQAQKTDFADFKEGFGGAVYAPQSFTFPTGAEGWAGFANMNTAMYPLTFENGGTINFDAPAEAVGSVIRFRFERLPFPDVDPAYDTASHTIVAGANEIVIPSQGTNTFESFILYVETQDVTIPLNSISVTVFDTDGVTALATEYADFKEGFGGAVYAPQSFTFPTGAEGWAGFANMNTAMYPLTFENEGTINFDAPAEAVGSVIRFRFERLPFPDVDPAYDTASHTIVAGANEIVIPSQGANTFESFILYVETQDVTIPLNSISVTSDDDSDTPPAAELAYGEGVADFHEGFGGAVYTPQSFSFPTGAEGWAGFANMNTALYPLTFENGGNINFQATAEAVGSVIRFRFERLPFPDVDPAYDTASHTIVAGVNQIEIPSQGTNTFESFILYVETQDVDVSIRTISVSTYDTDGTTALKTEYPYFKEGFGGAVYTPQSFTFPTEAEGWAGFANMNTGLYPFTFENGGTITFDAPATSVGSVVRFRFERLPFPDVDPAYDTASHTIVAGTNEIAIPSQGANTFESFLLYVETQDVPVALDLVQVTSGTTAGLEDNVLNAVKMFPNPARDYVQFSVNSTENLDIQIFDMLGKSVLRVDNVRNAVNVSELNAGLYFVQMTVGTQQATKKLVIK